MSHDPAIAAVKRAIGRDHMLPTNQVVAAREALKPIRERHRPFDRPIRYGSTETERVCNHRLGPRRWPCPDALDAYASEELER